MTEHLSPDILNNEDESPAPAAPTETPEEDSKLGNERVGLKEIRRRIQLKSGLKPLYRLSENNQFSDEEIIDHSRGWIEKYAGREENFSEVLKYFELAKEIISPEFSPEERAEVVCALAEIISEGHLDAETLNLLVSKIKRAPEAAQGQEQEDGYEGVAFYISPSGSRSGEIILLNKFFDKKENGERALKIAHMLKHEIGHSLITAGKVLSDKELQGVINPEENSDDIPKISAEIRRILNNAEENKDIETYHLSTVLASLHEFRQQTGVSEQEIRRREKMAANQIMAEKICLYLSSSGDFNDFLRANIEATSEENLKNIFSNQDSENTPSLDEIIKQINEGDTDTRQNNINKLRQDYPKLDNFMKSAHIFFELIKERVGDKEKLKETIGQEGHVESQLSGEEHDFFGYYNDGFYEPSTPNHGNENSGQRSDFLQITCALAEAFGGEVKPVIPITELERV